MQENPEFQEKKEQKESDFKAPEELETGYTEKSWEKPEKTTEEKEAGTETGVKPGEEKEKETKEEKEKEAKEEKRMVYTMKKRLTRSKSDRMVFGVCGGLGKYFGVDPTLIRLGFAFFTLLSGVGPGIVIYIIMAIIMPQEDSVEMMPETRKSS